MMREFDVNTVSNRILKMADKTQKVSSVLCSEQESDHKGTTVTAKIFNDHDE
jgi:hypothetical protein